MTTEENTNNEIATSEVHSAEVQSEGKLVMVEKNVPRVLVEVVTHCVAEDRKKMEKMLKDVQAQLEIRTARHRVRILFFVDNDGKTEEEKIQWLKDKAKSKYIVFIGENKKYHVDKNFIRETMITIKKFEDSFAKLKSSNILMNKNSVEKTKSEALGTIVEPLVEGEDAKVINLK